jgi:hypothetical protein
VRERTFCELVLKATAAPVAEGPTSTRITSVPSFYFDYADEGESFPDEIGTQLDTEEDALALAIESLRGIARDKRSTGNGEALVIKVKDDSGRCLYVVQNVMLWHRPA